ncbi:hypothetical protein TSH100_28495 [Azospirillum sp. TSH100]|uniref:hypothetical protein n=1 Tax=Azospirillum sp. TSH100 TaxID=652764 RepID=UPI000D6180EB|nr:hypothetical protein [Azospirillum sp. TSH100]PWC80994.1 hypothetical protein TSH100_28495 [Azospirillum sp. TSH100]QCG87213.1 hypothetical protein E6C72_05390 [Azospirillum sp. TSH100]
MLHIKDIEAFARINEALNDDQTAADQAGHDTSATGPAHPALVMAMLATGRLPLSALSNAAANPQDATPKAADPLAPWSRMFRRT